MPLLAAAGPSYIFAIFSIFPSRFLLNWSCRDFCWEQFTDGGSKKKIHGIGVVFTDGGSVAKTFINGGWGKKRSWMGVEEKTVHGWGLCSWIGVNHEETFMDRGSSWRNEETFMDRGWLASKCVDSVSNNAFTKMVPLSSCQGCHSLCLCLYLNLHAYISKYLGILLCLIWLVLSDSQKCIDSLLKATTPSLWWWYWLPVKVNSIRFILTYHLLCRIILWMREDGMLLPSTCQQQTFLFNFFLSLSFLGTPSLLVGSTLHPTLHSRCTEASCPSLCWNVVSPRG